MEEKEVIVKALDKLGLALAEHGHEWAVEERELYERSISYAQALSIGKPALTKNILGE